MLNIAIIESIYYQNIAEALCNGVRLAIDKEQKKRDIKISQQKISVQGALELPFALQMAIKSKKFHAAVIIGCVIKGQTDHYHIVAKETVRKIMDIALQYDFPIGNAVLTVYNMQQAIERARDDSENKGEMALRACIDLIDLQKTLPNKPKTIE